MRYATIFLVLFAALVFSRTAALAQSTLGTAPVKMEDRGPS